MIPMGTEDERLVRFRAAGQATQHILSDDALMCDVPGSAQRRARQRHRLEFPGLRQLLQSLKVQPGLLEQCDGDVTLYPTLQWHMRLCRIIADDIVYGRG